MLRTAFIVYMYITQNDNKQHNNMFKYIMLWFYNETDRLFFFLTGVNRLLFAFLIVL